MNEEKYCVYKHTAPNGKIYIGQTKKDPSSRWKNGHGYYTQTYFGRAIKKYGWENFTHEILKDGLTKEEADNYEKYYIALFQSNMKEKGYNAQSGGNRDYTYSDEAKQNISDGLKKHYKKCGKPNTAHARSFLMKKVVQYDLMGDKIREWDCGKFADEYYGSSNRRVCMVCRYPDRYKTAYGFQWRYKTDGLTKIEPIDSLVMLVDSNNHILGVYESTAEAARANGCVKTTVQNSLHKKSKTIRTLPGCKFIYAKDYKEVEIDA